MSNNITHQATQETLKELKERLRAKAPYLPLSLQETLKLVEELQEFELGRYLLKHRGLNGYWIRYLVLYPLYKDSYKNLHPLEEWILTCSPIVTATQERFQIFQKETKACLHSSMTLASIPCGLMDSLLSLDYSPYSHITLVGIDIDEEILMLAQENARKLAFNGALHFIRADAWHLPQENAYDLILSNGLSIYEKDQNKLLQLFQSFAKALVSRGILITSFVTPHPALDPNSPWKIINKEDMVKQKILFGDILETKWQAYRTETEMRTLLEIAGFTVEKVIFDHQGMFPTIRAQKNA